MPTRLFALLGHPVAHSLSPRMYAAAFKALGIDARYDAFDVKPEDLARKLTDLHDAGYEGINLTAPLKTFGADLVENSADFQTLKSVNTLVRTQGGWQGWNTDGTGLAEALKADLDVDLKGANVVILGAGGAACSAAIECLAQEVDCLWIANRSAVRLNELMCRLKPLRRLTPIIAIYPDVRLLTFPPDTVVINATSCGMNADDPSPFDLRYVPKGRVFDMTYAYDTALLKQARVLGLKSANGLSMLLYQGVGALELWMGHWMAKPVVDAMSVAIRAKKP